MPAALTLRLIVSDVTRISNHVNNLRLLMTMLGAVGVFGHALRDSIGGSRLQISCHSINLACQRRDFLWRLLVQDPPNRDGMGHEGLFTMKRAKERDERGCRGPLDFDLTSAERANEPDSVGLRVSSVSQ